VQEQHGGVILKRVADVAHHRTAEMSERALGVVTVADDAVAGERENSPARLRASVIPSV
jgi:hypothetical protein